MEKEKEQLIIKKIRSGETEHYKQLVDAYSAPVFSFIKSMANNYEDSKDITQEVFIKGFFSLDKYRGESTFFSWIYRIAYNETISFLRKKNKKSSINFIENIEYPDKFINALAEDGVALKLEQEREFEKLNRALKELETEEHILIYQFYYNNKSIKELQDITGLTESNVKVKLFRAKKRLAVLITKQGG